ncbi:MAG: S46 family peptidase [Saprospiraceae bacterium]|nr:S46 family peptidase [Saprospiraceae bacterium]
MKNIKLICFILFLFQSSDFIAQEKEASPFDFGRMWTFENPPIDWFKEAYGIDADQAWFDDVRKSSLRFASWCSASFVSPNGLIMTNHHCSRDVAISVQNEGENFDNNGFYAEALADERRVDDLFVEQLIRVDDITDIVKAESMSAENDTERAAIEAQAIEDIKADYQNRKDWMHLRLQVVSFYSGGKYSIYGYKKFSDIRLVLIPENDLGFYGGDPDNFTYPRYNLDFTFWRAYDENGEPLNTSANYYEFNIDGIEEGTPVFVVGNPGSTERYRTMAQLEYDRDHRFKYLLRWLKNRRDMMLDEYNAKSDEEKGKMEAQELLGTINNLSNSIKAYDGIVGGLHNDAFMKRKKDMEESIKAASPGFNYWAELENEYAKLSPHGWAIAHLRPISFRGNVFALMHQLASYKKALEKEDADEKELEEAKNGLIEMAGNIDIQKEKVMLKLLLKEIKTDIYPGDNTLSRILEGQSINQFVDNLFEESKILKSKESAEKCISRKKNITKVKDPLVKASTIVANRYNEAAAAFGNSNDKRKGLEAKIANQAFNVYGTSLPPDATFTLRISDGVVKKYDYNGTTAPIKTTFFGLYDRHYSNDQEFPWSLPEKWQNPSLELLKSPLNIVSTNDIIGGNSGSALINANGEAVGLIFDGNIESLPGNFIFDEKANRSVSVHAGGIHAALKHVYKAKRLIKELMGK